jgi:mycoredoxin
VIVYTTQWCGYCFRLKADLQRAGIAFDVVDIEQDPAAEQLVREVNQGNATVPTVVFEDGSSSTNPSITEVRARLGGSMPASHDVRATPHV